MIALKKKPNTTKQWPLHTQFRCTSCKKLARMFRRKDCKEPEDISGEICLYIDEMDVEGDITVNVERWWRTPSLHKTLCPSLTTVAVLLPPSHHYCRYISRPIPLTAPPSLHKTLCPSLTTVTALLPPSHHYCRYISRPIPVTAPHSLHKTLCPSLTTVTALYLRHTITAAK